MILLHVSLDNYSFTMIILDLSLSHSFAHQIDPKNGLNVSFLLPLCSFTLASVMGEGHILAFDTDHSYLTFIFGPKGPLCQECDNH